MASIIQLGLILASFTIPLHAETTLQGANVCTRQEKLVHFSFFNTNIYKNYRNIFTQNLPVDLNKNNQTNKREIVL